MGSTTSMSVVKGLRRDRRNRYRIVGTDANHLNVAGRVKCDAFYSMPHYRDSNYGEMLEGIAKREKVDVVIPIIDGEVERIARVIDSMPYCSKRCVIPDYQTVRTCNDKHRLYQKLKRSPEFGAPWSIVIKDGTPPDGVLFPAIIKPRRGISSVDCFKISNNAELAVFAERIHNPIVCGFLEGGQYVIDTLSDAGGKCLLSVPRREIEAKAGIGVKAEICMDGLLVAYGRQLVEYLGIAGPACIEVMRKGDFVGLIEINPRASAGLIVTVKAGVNVPSLIVDVVRKQKIDRRRTVVRKQHLYMSRHWQEVYYEGSLRDSG